MKKADRTPRKPAKPRAQKAKKTSRPFALELLTRRMSFGVRSILCTIAPVGPRRARPSSHLGPFEAMQHLLQRSPALTATFADSYRRLGVH
jgi:hypothetical protein